MSSTEPLFFILCSCQKSRQRTNHHHHQQQQKNHYLSSCVPCQKARHWSQIRGNTCQSQVVTEQYVSWAYTNIQINTNTTITNTNTNGNTNHKHTPVTSRDSPICHHGHPSGANVVWNIEICTFPKCISDPAKKIIIIKRMCRPSHSHLSKRPRALCYSRTTWRNLPAWSSKEEKGGFSPFFVGVKHRGD